MKLSEAFDIFEQSFIDAWGEYKKLHDEFDLYRGKEIGDNHEKINQLVQDIQKKFLEIYPVIIFVSERQGILKQVLHSYTSFIEDLKKAGAVEMKEVQS